MIYQVGNCVEILGQLIPAVNIQVEGMPGMIEMFDKDVEEWFPLYFEVMFEDGTLWVVEQGDDPRALDEIVVAEYVDFAVRKHSMEPDYSWMKRGWEEFLEVYNLQRNRRRVA